MEKNKKNGVGKREKSAGPIVAKKGRDTEIKRGERGCYLVKIKINNLNKGTTCQRSRAFKKINLGEISKNN